MKVGLALSGGGFRAAAFHLGVLKRLEELGVLAQVEMLSCVSGGALTGALYALRCAERGDGTPGSYPVDALIAELRPVITSNLRGRALLGTSARAWRTLRSFSSRYVSRVGLIADELDRELFHAAPLNRLPSWALLNATNLRTGKAWKFYSDQTGDYLAGVTDRTATIRVADAVAASAAYPGLTDSYGFDTAWEELRGDLLSKGRWERAPTAQPEEASRWRTRFGAAQGRVTFPLVDGGVYDNEGLNGLRSARVTHAILSSTVPPENDSAHTFGPLRLLRVIEVMHARLGAATRQLAFEMTHAVHPNEVSAELRGVAQELRSVVHDLAPAEAATIHALADRIVAAAPVGAPTRGHQFTASAPILLNKTDLARNAFNEPPSGSLDVPAEQRGLGAAIIDELSRVRTDLDALEPAICDLLICQGYYLTDAYAKVCLPELVRSASGVANLDGDGLRPGWRWAGAVVAAANAAPRVTADTVASAGRGSGPIGRVIGRCTNPAEHRTYLRNLTLVSALMLLFAAPVMLLLVVVCAAAGVGMLGWAVLWSLLGRGHPAQFAVAETREPNGPTQ